MGWLAISEKRRLTVDNALSSLVSQPRDESKPKEITPKTMSSLGHQDLKNLNKAVFDLVKKTKQEEFIKDDDFLEKLVTDIIKKSNVTSKSPSRCQLDSSLVKESRYQRSQTSAFDPDLRKSKKFVLKNSSTSVPEDPPQAFQKNSRLLSNRTQDQTPPKPPAYNPPSQNTIAQVVDEFLLGKYSEVKNCNGSPMKSQNNTSLLMKKSLASIIAVEETLTEPTLDIEQTMELKREFMKQLKINSFRVKFMKFWSLLKNQNSRQGIFDRMDTTRTVDSKLIVQKTYWQHLKLHTLRDLIANVVRAARNRNQKSRQGILDRMDTSRPVDSKLIVQKTYWQHLKLHTLRDLITNVAKAARNKKQIQELQSQNQKMINSFVGIPGGSGVKSEKRKSTEFEQDFTTQPQDPDFRSKQHDSTLKISTATPKNYLITGDSNGNLKQWAINATHLTQIHAYSPPHPSPISLILITPDTRHFFTSSTSSHLDQYSLHPFTLLFTYPKIHTHSISSLISTPNSQHLFTGGLSLIQWSIPTGTLLRDYKNIHQSQIISLAVTNDNQYLFTASEDQRLKQIDIQKQEVCKDYGKIHRN